MARILRTVLSTGFLGSADRSVMEAAGALSRAFWPQRVSLLTLVSANGGSTTPLLSLSIDAC